MQISSPNQMEGPALSESKNYTHKIHGTGIFTDIHLIVYGESINV